MLTPSLHTPSSRWLVTGAGEVPPEVAEGVYIHSDSPARGHHWNTAPLLAFDKLKLTNNKNGSRQGQVSFICIY